MSGLLLVLLLACGPEPAAPEHSAAPAAPIEPPRTPQQAVERLLDLPLAASSFEDPMLRSLELMRHEDREQVMALLPLEPGQRVVDLGCGIGHFTFDLARAVGSSGRVWAVDIEPRFLEVLEQRRTDPGYPHPGNISVARGALDRVPSGVERLDLALLAHLDFHLVRPLAPEHHLALLRSVEQALVPGGRVAVLQWLGAREGAKVEDLVANYLDLGLELEARHDLEEHDSVLLILRKQP